MDAHHIRSDVSTRRKIAQYKKDTPSATVPQIIQLLSEKEGIATTYTVVRKWWKKTSFEDESRVHLKNRKTSNKNQQQQQQQQKVKPKKDKVSEKERDTIVKFHLTYRNKNNGKNPKHAIAAAKFNLHVKTISGILKKYTDEQQKEHGADGINLMQTKHGEHSVEHRRLVAKYKTDNPKLNATQVMNHFKKVLKINVGRGFVKRWWKKTDFENLPNNVGKIKTATTTSADASSSSASSAVAPIIQTTPRIPLFKQQKQKRDNSTTNSTIRAISATSRNKQQKQKQDNSNGGYRETSMEETATTQTATTSAAVVSSSSASSATNKQQKQERSGNSGNELSGEEREKIVKYKEENLNCSIRDAAKALGFTILTVRRWWNRSYYENRKRMCKKESIIAVPNQESRRVREANNEVSLDDTSISGANLFSTTSSSNQQQEFSSLDIDYDYLFDLAIGNDTKQILFNSNVSFNILLSYDSKYLEKLQITVDDINMLVPYIDECNVISNNNNNNNNNNNKNNTSAGNNNASADAAASSSSQSAGNNNTNKNNKNNKVKFVDEQIESPANSAVSPIPSVQHVSSSSSNNNNANTNDLSNNDNNESFLVQSKITSKRAAELMQSAHPHFNNNKYAKAVTFYSKIINAIPMCVNDHGLKSILSEALCNRAGCRLELKQQKEALVDARKCVVLSPDLALGHVRVAEAAKQLKQVDETIRAYEAAITAIKAGDCSANESQKELETLLTKFTYDNVTEICSKGSTKCTSVYSNFSSTTSILLASAVKLVEQGNRLFYAQQYDAAVSVFSKVIGGVSVNSNGDLLIILTRALSNRSGCFRRMNKPYEALEDARKCAELRPDWCRAQLRRAEAAERLEQFDEAYVAYEYAIKAEDRVGVVPSDAELEKDLQRVRKKRNELGVASCDRNCCTPIPRAMESTITFFNRGQPFTFSLNDILVFRRRLFKSEAPEVETLPVVGNNSKTRPPQGSHDGTIKVVISKNRDNDASFPSSEWSYEEMTAADAYKKIERLENDDNEFVFYMDIGCVVPDHSRFMFPGENWNKMAHWKVEVIEVDDETTGGKKNKVDISVVKKDCPWKLTFILESDERREVEFTWDSDEERARTCALFSAAGYLRGDGTCWLSKDHCTKYKYGATFGSDTILDSRAILSALCKIAGATGLPGCAREPRPFPPVIGLQNKRALGVESPPVAAAAAAAAATAAAANGDDNGAVGDDNDFFPGNEEEGFLTEEAEEEAELQLELELDERAQAAASINNKKKKKNNTNKNGKEVAEDSITPEKQKQEVNNTNKKEQKEFIINNEKSISEDSITPEKQEVTNNNNNNDNEQKKLAEDSKTPQKQQAAVEVINNKNKVPEDGKTPTPQKQKSAVEVINNNNNNNKKIGEDSITPQKQQAAVEVIMNNNNENEKEQHKDTASILLDNGLEFNSTYMLNFRSLLKENNKLEELTVGEYHDLKKQRYTKKYLSDFPSRFKIIGGHIWLRHEILLLTLLKELKNSCSNVEENIPANSPEVLIDKFEKDCQDLSVKQTIFLDKVEGVRKIVFEQEIGKKEERKPRKKNEKKNDNNNKNNNNSSSSSSSNNNSKNNTNDGNNNNNKNNSNKLLIEMEVKVLGFREEVMKVRCGEASKSMNCLNRTQMIWDEFIDIIMIHEKCYRDALESWYIIRATAIVQNENNNVCLNLDPGTSLAIQATARQHDKVFFPLAVGPIGADGVFDAEGVNHYILVVVDRASVDGDNRSVVLVYDSLVEFGFRYGFKEEKNMEQNYMYSLLVRRACDFLNVPPNADFKLRRGFGRQLPGSNDCAVFSLNNGIGHATIQQTQVAPEQRFYERPQIRKVVQNYCIALGIKDNFAGGFRPPKVVAAASSSST